MKKSLVRIFIFVTMLCLSYTKVSGSVLEQIIDIKIQGTSIDIMPESIHVIVDNPKVEIKKLLKQRKISDTKIPNTIRMYGVLISFFAPLEHQEVGDIIYHFLVESNKDKERFINKYNLILHAVRKGFDGSEYSEYISKLGYYVTFGVKTKMYVCDIHSEIIKNEKGICEKCGKILLEEEVYK